LINEQEILKDIRKRHSTLHDIDKHCVTMMEALTKAMPAAGEHKLLGKLDTVCHAISALHAAARSKFEAIE
jgi:hypothetical protein